MTSDNLTIGIISYIDFKPPKEHVAGEGVERLFPRSITHVEVPGSPCRRPFVALVDPCEQDCQSSIESDFPTQLLINESENLDFS